jgi:uncharacterized CHY-type Zn-finger protein
MAAITKTKLNKKFLATKLAENELKYQNQLKAKKTATKDYVPQAPPPTTNELADMCWKLSKCFQCGLNIPEDDIMEIKKIRTAGNIVICPDCKEKIEKHNNGEETNLSLPFAATEEMKTEYKIFIENTSNE